MIANARPDGFRVDCTRPYVRSRQSNLKFDKALNAHSDGNLGLAGSLARPSCATNGKGASCGSRRPF